MDTLYFDWSMTRGLAVLREKNQEWNCPEDVELFASIDTLLDRLPNPMVLISESTFESFNIDRRISLTQRVEKEGHRWLVLSPRQTPRARNKLELEKDDVNDVIAIRYIARTSPSGLKTPTLDGRNSQRAKRLRNANDELMPLRREYDTVEAPRRALGVKFISHKDQYANRISAQLPDYKSLSEVQKIALGDGKEYSKPLLAAAAVATKHSTNRADYEFILGLFSNGYPCQTRSDTMHWRWNTIRKSQIKKNKYPDFRLTDFRRELRWLYHQLKEIDL